MKNRELALCNCKNTVIRKERWEGYPRFRSCLPFLSQRSFIVRSALSSVFSISISSIRFSGLAPRSGCFTITSWGEEKIQKKYFSKNIFGKKIIFYFFRKNRFLECESTLVLPLRSGPFRAPSSCPWARWSASNSRRNNPNSKNSKNQKFEKIRRQLSAWTVTVNPDLLIQLHQINGGCYPPGLSQ